MEMTVQEILEYSINEIENIQVPVSLANQIARPLCGVVANLRLIVDSMQPKEEVKEGDADVV